MARSRRAAILRYAASVKRCRREILMEALGSQAEDCPGCDICGGSALSEAPEQALILRTVRQNRGRFQKGDLARVLIGRKTSAIRRAGLHYTRGFGTLAGWELEDAEEAVETLIRAGWLCRRSWGIGPFGLKKNRIWPAPQKKAERTVFQAG
ncbi:MAG: hypothetical protein CSA76_01085 [Spirochaetales bacterium]|nr:MAG: hypothetical protein CSA76_01085 [Spirochaetales bacterium]